MKITTAQFNQLVTGRPALGTLTLDGTTDYNTIVDVLTKPLVKAIAIKFNTTQSKVVFGLINHITELDELTDADVDLLAGL